MRLEERIVIGAEMPRDALTLNRGVEHAAQVDARDGSRVHGDADEPTGDLILDHEYPIAPQHEGFAAKRSTLQRQSVVCPITDNHEGLVPSGAKTPPTSDRPGIGGLTASRLAHAF